MGIISHTLNQEAKIVTTTQDKHGDQISSSETSIKCRFRYITELDRNSNKEGLESFDAIVWFEPDANIQEASIIFADGKYWRINRLIKARRLSGSIVEFLKGFVKKHDL
jgi:hypothetical protein